jgi:hypothetical protein
MRFANSSIEGKTKSPSLSWGCGHSILLSEIGVLGSVSFGQNRRWCRRYVWQKNIRNVFAEYIDSLAGQTQLSQPHA